MKGPLSKWQDMAMSSAQDAPFCGTFRVLLVLAGRGIFQWVPDSEEEIGGQLKPEPGCELAGWGRQHLETQTAEQPGVKESILQTWGLGPTEMRSFIRGQRSRVKVSAGWVPSGGSRGQWVPCLSPSFCWSPATLSFPGSAHASLQPLPV